MLGSNLAKTLLIIGCTAGLAACGSYHHHAQNVDANKRYAQNAQDVRSAESKPSYVAQLKVQPIKRVISSTVHFKFDDNRLNDSDKTELDSIASYLVNNPGTKVQVEGYADVRGRATYNVALGMRRAQAVAKYLQDQGVAESQIITKSYGAEKFAEEGDSNQAHAANRRAVVYFEAVTNVA